MAGGEWRVLVVDDEADLRHLLCLSLSFDERIQVVASVGTGREALDAMAAAARWERIHVVVLDRRLGGPLDGLAIGRCIRQRWPGTKLVLISCGDAQELREAVPLFDAVVPKIDMVRLPEVVMAAVEPRVAVRR